MAVKTIYYEGTLIDENQFGRWKPDTNITISRVDVSDARDAPVGADAQFDILIDDVEQSCNGGNLIILPDGTSSHPNALSSPEVIAVGEEFSLKVKQIGSTTEGEGITIDIYYTVSAPSAGVGRTLLQMRTSATQRIMSLTSLNVNSERKAELDRIANRIYERIVADIPHALRDKARLRTEDPYNTGTAAATAGSTTFTGSGTTWLFAHNGWYLIFALESIPYIVTFVSTTGLTADKAYVGSGSGGSYNLIKAEHSLASDCAKLLNMRDLADDEPIDLLSLSDFRAQVPSSYDIGDPDKATVLGDGSLIFDRLPEEAKIYEYEYEVLIAELVADGDYPACRKDLHYLIELGMIAEFLALHYEDVPQSAIARATNHFENEFSIKMGSFGHIKTEPVTQCTDL